VSGSKLRVQDDKGFDWLEFEVKFTTHSWFYYRVQSPSPFKASWTVLYSSICPRE